MLFWWVDLLGINSSTTSTFIGYSDWISLFFPFAVIVLRIVGIKKQLYYM